MTQNIDKSLDDQSNAAMTHTSEGIMATDFVMRDIDLNKEPEMQRESKNFWQDAWAQLKRNKLAIVGMIGLILIVILAFIGPMLSHHDYAEQDVNRRNLPAKIPVLDKVSFYHLMAQVLTGQMHMIRQSERKLLVWYRPTRS